MSFEISVNPLKRVKQCPKFNLEWSDLKNFDDNAEIIHSNGFMAPQKLPENGMKKPQNILHLRKNYVTDIPLRNILHKMKLDLLQNSTFHIFTV